MKKTVISLSILICCFVAAGEASAQVVQRIRFRAGASSASVVGTVRGYAYRDYIIGAREGQRISVKLTSPNTYTVFSIFLPGGDNLDRATEMDEFSGDLPVNGDYVIRVLIMRAGARRPGAVANFRLGISVR